MNQDYSTASYPAPTLIAPPVKARRSPTQIVIALALALLIVVAGVLIVSLVKTSTRANHAEALASSRAKQIHTLEGEGRSLQAQLSRTESDLTDANARATKAEGQVDLWRRAGAGQAAFFNQAKQTSPSMAIVGQDLTVQVGQSMCSALARGVSPDTIVNQNTYFPTAEVRALLTDAQAFLC